MLQKSKKNKEEKDQSEKKPAAQKNNLDILPIRYYDEDAKAFVLKDGSYFDIYEKVADDVDNMMEDEVQMLMIRLAKFLKLYKDDIKIISMNVPTNLLSQEKRLTKKMQETNDPVRKKWLQRSISELQRAEKGTRKREYYFVLMSRTAEQHHDQVQQLSILGDGVREISLEKKLQIVYKLCNPNSLIVREEGIK